MSDSKKDLSFGSLVLGVMVIGAILLAMAIMVGILGKVVLSAVDDTPKFKHQYHEEVTWPKVLKAGEKDIKIERNYCDFSWVAIL